MSGCAAGRTRNVREADERPFLSLLSHLQKLHVTIVFDFSVSAVRLSCLRLFFFFCCNLLLLSPIAFQAGLQGDRQDLGKERPVHPLLCGVQRRVVWLHRGEWRRGHGRSHYAATTLHINSRHMDSW